MSQNLRHELVLDCPTVRVGNDTKQFRFLCYNAGQMEENRYPQDDNIRDNGGYSTKPIDNVRLTQCGILLSFLFLLIAALSVHFDPFARGVDLSLIHI